MYDHETGTYHNFTEVKEEPSASFPCRHKALHGGNIKDGPL